MISGCATVVVYKHERLRNVQGAGGLIIVAYIVSAKHGRSIRNIVVLMNSFQMQPWELLITQDHSRLLGCFFVGWLVGLVVLLLVWLVGLPWLFFVGWLVGFVGLLVVFCWLVGWLVGWLVWFLLVSVCCTYEISVLDMPMAVNCVL